MGRNITPEEAILSVEKRRAYQAAWQAKARRKREEEGKKRIALWTDAAVAEKARAAGFTPYLVWAPAAALNRIPPSPRVEHLRDNDSGADYYMLLAWNESKLDSNVESKIESSSCVESNIESNIDSKIESIADNGGEK
jgi:hypothetical protein